MVGPLKGPPGGATDGSDERLAGINSVSRLSWSLVKPLPSWKNWSKRQINASSLVLRPLTIETRLGSTCCSSFRFRSLSIRMTRESGYVSPESRVTSCSTLSSNTRNSSLRRTGTRLQLRSFTVTGTTTVDVVIRIVGGPCCLSAGFGSCAVGGAAGFGGVGSWPKSGTTKKLSKGTAAKKALFRGQFMLFGPNFLRLV